MDRSYTDQTMKGQPSQALGSFESQVPGPQGHVGVLDVISHSGLPLYGFFKQPARGEVAFWE